MICKQQVTANIEVMENDGIQQLPLLISESTPMLLLEGTERITVLVAYATSPANFLSN